MSSTCRSKNDQLLTKRTNATVARYSTTPTATPAATAQPHANFGERDSRPVASEARPTAPVMVPMAVQTLTRPATTTRHATTTPAAPAAMRAKISTDDPSPRGGSASWKESHLGSQLGGERRDHGEVEEAGRRLNGGGACPPQGDPDEHRDQTGADHHPDGDPGGAAGHSEEGVQSARGPSRAAGRSDRANDHRRGLQDDRRDQQPCHPVDGSPGQPPIGQVPVAQQEPVQNRTGEHRSGQELEERQGERLVGGPGEGEQRDEGQGHG